MKILILLIYTFITNANADCTSKDLTDPDYLKSVGKDNLIEHFKKPRDQDGVGWCGAYAPADSLSFAVGEPVSAIDISIHYYANDWKRKGLKLEELRGVSPLSATSLARENGYCPESVIPSDQTSSSNLGHYAILKLMESFQKLYDDYAAHGKSEAYCVDCTKEYEKVIKPALPGVTSEMIKDVLLKNQDDSVQAFKNLLDQLCEGRRIKVKPKVDYITKMRLGKKTIASVLDDALDNDSMPSIGINTSSFANLKSVPGGHGAHEMMIVARKMNENGKCEYLVRNSWGKGCSFYQPQLAAKCNPAKGAFWMDQDELQTAVTDIVVIEDQNGKVSQDSSQTRILPILKGIPKDITDSNVKPDPRFKIDKQKVNNFLEKASETATRVFKDLAESARSIWKTFSRAFKY